MKQDNSVLLKGGGVYITESSVNAYRVSNGEVLMYIVPVINGKPGRRSFCYKATVGEVIPGFCYNDIDGNSWRFCFAAAETASLEIIENGATKILCEKFAKKAGIRNYEVEGFNGGLVDQYRINTVAEDSFIIKSQRDREQTARKILELIQDSFSKNSEAQLGDKIGKPLYDCISVICRKKRITIAPYEKVKQAYGDEPQLADIARVSHFSYRKVILEENWYKNDQGEMVAFLADGTPVALFPKGGHSYEAYNPKNGERKKITAKNAEKYDVNAYVICKPLPTKKLGFKDIFHFGIASLKATDAVILLVLSVVVALIGLIVPIISQKLYDEFIPLGAESILFQLGGLMTAFLASNVMFSVVKNLSQYKIAHHISYDFQNAVYDRLFNLPESFFRQFESADLAQRVMAASGIVASCVTVMVVSIAAIINLVICLVRMGLYSAELMWIGLLMTVVYSAVYYIINSLSLKHDFACAELEGNTSSIMYQFVGGISKIRIAGVEDRAIYEFLKPYSRLRVRKEVSGKIAELGSVISLAAGSIFSIVFYIIVVKSELKVSIGEFIAFNTVFGSFSAAVAQLVDGMLQIRRLRPAIDRLEPILSALPEYDDAKELPGNITGEIEISNIVFSYSDDSPNAIDGLSLNIKAGEYVGIVGASGCGKSTLLKILLGFEKPKSGKVFYDNKDIESLDKRELRKKIGVVLQDGKLISGSIFENIAITSPSASKADVEEAVKSVGLMEDINEMPMGLNTVLSENCGTISGGQKQRILIARALISKPKILFFDEATSALDNVTQRTVTDTLERIPATKLVIAHRLSTVINCDRIIVLDKGRIAEQGTYAELMQKEGLFRQFASRQMA